LPEFVGGKAQEASIDPATITASAATAPLPRRDPDRSEIDRWAKPPLMCARPPMRSPRQSTKARREPSHQ
jgi:hypothetical protein